MKNLKIALFGLMVLAIGTLGTAFSSNAQTSYFSTYSGSTFTNGTTITSDINNLAVVGNWSTLITSNPGFGSGTDLAAIEVVVGNSQPVPDVDATSKQNFYNALKTYYTSHSNLFPSSTTSFSITATISGASQSYTVKIQYQ